MKRLSSLPRFRGKRYAVAVLLGTALSTFAPAPAVNGADLSSSTVHAVTGINRYCSACWRNARLHPDCWQDCTQEVFCRLLERVDPDSWTQVLTAEGDERRELIRAIDTVKKRVQRARKWSSGLVDLAADPRELPDRQLADDRETVGQAARQVLSPRQQRILQLSFEGWSVNEIATKLRLPAARISDEKYKSIHKLREHLQSA